MADNLAIPGERLGSTDEYQPGTGTYVRGGFIYSKLVGKKTFKEDDVNGSSTTQISIQSGDESKHLVPEKGMVFNIIQYITAFLIILYFIFQSFFRP